MSQVGDVIKVLLSDILLAFVAYQVVGWLGPVVVISAYALGFFANLTVAYKSHQKEIEKMTSQIKESEKNIN